MLICMHVWLYVGLYVGTMNTMTSIKSLLTCLHDCVLCQCVFAYAKFNAIERDVM